MKLKLKTSIATSENGFIFNPATGDSFVANPLAAEILLLLKENQASADIKTTILARYDVSAARLEADWDDLVAQLREFNLLDYSPELKPEPPLAP